VRKTILFALAAAMMALLGNAWAQGQVNYNVTFPRYALVVTDMSNVNWDFSATTDPGTAAGKAQYTSGVYRAWTGGLAQCFTDRISGSITVQDTAGTNSLAGNCTFAPTSVVLGGPVNVDWSTNYTVAPDGTLVVITNATNFRVDAQITTDWGSLTGASLLVLNDATDNGTSWLSGTTPTLSSYTALSSATATTLVDTSASSGLYKATNYANVYAVPTIWALQFDPTAQPDISGGDTAVVTFTGTALP